MKRRASLTDFERSSLDPRLRVLGETFKAEIVQLRRAGWDEMELSDALIDHFAQSDEKIFPETVRQVLSDPTRLILEYRKRTKKPNRPSSNQSLVLMRLIKKDEQRERVLGFLSLHFVIDQLPAKAFREILEELRVHEWLEPEVQAIPTAVSRQGRAFKWNHSTAP